MGETRGGAMSTLTAIAAAGTAFVIGLAICVAALLAMAGEKLEACWLRRKHKRRNKRNKPLLLEPSPDCQRFPDHRATQLRTSRNYVM